MLDHQKFQEYLGDRILHADEINAGNSGECRNSGSLAQNPLRRFPIPLIIPVRLVITKGRQFC